MADYRQGCMDPACTYTGFSGHSPWCKYSGVEGISTVGDWLDTRFEYLLTAGGIKFYECVKCLAVVRGKKREGHLRNSHNIYG